MAVVIRLQGLNATAGTEDIRKFFTGLKIPHGGVHIIGGELEEAFIIFASDEDARRAMRRSLGCIMGSPVTLLLSSKTEMQDMLERSTKAAIEQKRRPEENARRDGKSVDHEMDRRPVSRSDNSPRPHRQGPSGSDDDLFLFLRGLPYTATEKDILNFFSGLAVDDIMLLDKAPGTGIVKFATSQDAYEGLKRDREYIGSRYVEVSRHRGPHLSGFSGNLQMDRNRDNSSVRERSPIRQRNPQPHVRQKSPAVSPEEEYCVLVENLAYTVEKIDIKLLFSKANLKDDQILHLLSSDGRRTRCAFVLFRSQRDYCEALSDEKRLFQNRWVVTRPISREKMITLLESKDRSDRPYGDSERVQERLPSSYPRDGYDSERAMGISDGSYPRDGFNPEIAMGMSDGAYPRVGYDSERAMGISDRPYHTERIQDRPSLYPDGGYDSEKCCLLVQNLPPDVRKAEIMNFFLGFNVTEDMVFIIGGDGVGKALVLFRSEAEAMSVLSLDGQRFLGSEVILKCISRSQMQQLRYNQSMTQTQMVQNQVPGREQYPGSNVAPYCPDDTKYPDYRIPSDGQPQVGHPSVQLHGNPSHEPYAGGPFDPQDRGNGFQGNYDAPVPSHEGPTCVQLLNLPFRIEREEIYDFCYGYQIIQGSVQLQFDRSGRPDGTATAAFESHQEALKAIRELSGRPIGPRRIDLVLM